MPYPILQLPYGLQRRLRSLTTQKELYHLQIAVGLETHHLSPLQMCKKYFENHFYLQNNDGKLDLSTNAQFLQHYNVVNWENDSLTLVDGCLHMTYLQPSDMDRPIFDHLLINCDSVSFWFGTVVNATVLHQFAKHCNRKTVVCFEAEDGTSTDLTLSLICEIFENLNSINLKNRDCAYNHWIRDILRLKKLNLKELSIRGRFEALFSFEPNELSQLFQEQHMEFFLALHCDDAPPNAVELIRQKLGTHFKEFKYKKGHIDGVLYVNLSHETSSTSQMWFQVGPETNRANYDVFHLPN